MITLQTQERRVDSVQKEFSDRICDPKKHFLLFIPGWEICNQRQERKRGKAESIPLEKQ
jgi:hypothetical protein